MSVRSKLGPFVVHEVAGRGGTSLVYRGEHEGPTGRTTDVAIKVMRSDYRASPGARTSFLGGTSLNLALVHLQRGDFESAIHRVEELLSDFSDRGAAMFEQFALATLLCAYAGGSRWEDARIALGRYEASAADLEIADPDLEWVLWRTLQQSSAGGIVDIEERLAPLAQWQQARLAGVDGNDR